jgi:hypothetical protein
MTEHSNQEELRRRLEQARRMAAEPSDPTTKQRLATLVHELEEQLRTA